MHTCNIMFENPITAPTGMNRCLQHKQAQLWHAIVGIYIRTPIHVLKYKRSCRQHISDSHAGKRYVTIHLKWGRGMQLRILEYAKYWISGLQLSLLSPKKLGGKAHVTHTHHWLNTMHARSPHRQPTTTWLHASYPAPSLEARHHGGRGKGRSRCNGKKQQRAGLVHFLLVPQTNSTSLSAQTHWAIWLCWHWHAWRGLRT